MKGGKWDGYRRNKIGDMLITAEVRDGYVGVHCTVLSTFVHILFTRGESEMAGPKDMTELKHGTCVAHA